MGESALKSHMKGKKHINHAPSDNCQSLNIHFQKSKKNEEPTITGQVITNSSLVTNKNQAAIDNMFKKENVSCSEIRWALKTKSNQNFRFVLVRVPTHFSVKCFLTAKLHIVLVFQEQNVIIF